MPDPQYHAVCMLAYNRTPEHLELTKAAVASVLAQDIGPIDFYFVNNGSTPETHDWLVNGFQKQGSFGHTVNLIEFPENRSPVKIGNELAARIFAKHDKVLGVSNDVILPPNAYRLMSRCPRGIVTATETGERNFEITETARPFGDNTPMAVNIMRRWAYNALVEADGYFLDENFFNYESDVDLGLRFLLYGIRGVQLDLQYYHYGSATQRVLGEDKDTNPQNILDCQYFEKKWKFHPRALIGIAHFPSQLMFLYGSGIRPEPCPLR